MLKNDNNIWVKDEDSLRIMASLFFQNLFRSENSVVQSDRFQNNFLEIDPAHLSMLSEPISDEQVKVAIFNIKSYSALGPDGFQPFFYQSQQSVVGKLVYEFIINIFYEKSEVAEVNQTHLVLISKVNALESLYQFRPIGLCNVNFKIVTKILVKKLKLIMPKLISESYSSYSRKKHHR